MKKRKDILLHSRRERQFLRQDIKKSFPCHDFARLKAMPCLDYQPNGNIMKDRVDL
jgi:hypothetical protein